MRLSPVALTTFVSFVTPALSWGSDGHQITATIAQIHLLPSTRKAVSNILPQDLEGRLARVASWPDEIKKQDKYKWSAGLHFVNAIGDSPPELCVFGQQGWNTNDNILEAIVNYTRRIDAQDGEERDHALRFFVHFLGDIHMPFHTAGKDLGGNKVPVMFEGHNTSLHIMWDDYLIAQRIRTLPNYTHPLPIDSTPSIPPSVLIRNQKIEAALGGSSYDPYVRFIVLEGIYGWWADKMTEWTTCPQLVSQDLGLSTSEQTVFSEAVRDENPPFEDPTNLPVCPYHWAAASHQLICDFAWPAGLSSSSPRKEMSNTTYAARVESEKIVEKQLALGGLRLAAALNTLLGDEEEMALYGVLPSLL
ncbi:phospholipase C/P1 nuclease [Ceratobasidium sp. AG-I]|nr:phospholipase C/P1 nuclease [Ceratobasidium sp. AG-I]